MNSLCFITVTFPPWACGIGDYTALLAGRLAGRLRVRVLTAHQTEPNMPLPGGAAEQVFDWRHLHAGRQLVEAVAADPPDWVFLQYDPYSWGMRYAFDPVIPAAMRRLRRRCPQTRLAVMFHETFAPPLTWKKALMRQWQRAQVRAVGQAADLVFVAIDPWVRELGPWFAGTPVVHLPLGSNVPRQPLGRDEARARLGLGPDDLVLGLFGRADATRDMECVRRAAAAVAGTGREVVVLYIGYDVDQVRLALPGVRLIDDNPHPKDEISRRFAAMDIHLLAIAREGVSTRRTTLMAGLEHEVATVATLGAATDDVLRREDHRALRLAPAADPEHFATAVAELAADPEHRRAIAAGGRALFDREFAWERIEARLLERLAATAAGHGRGEPSWVVAPA